MNTKSSTTVKLRSAAFVYRLDTRNGLRAVSWENLLMGQTLSLGSGNELGATLDTASQRITITGWRVVDDPAGKRQGFHRPEFDDSKWRSAPSPAIAWAFSTPRVAWARTHVFVPADCADQRMTLVLGGIGLWDFREMRVYLNGNLIGMRRVRDRWHAPGQFDVTRKLRLGQDNVIVLELRDQVRRTEHLDQLDPKRTHALGYGFVWPSQFEQFIVAGEAVEEATWRVENWRVERVGRVTFQLSDRRRKLTAQATYHWRANEPTLHKFVEITNRSARPVRLMDVELGRHVTNERVTDGEQGFPVYAADSFFFSVADPSGWAMGQRGAVTLRQHPGQWLAPGETFRAMEVVLGVTDSKQARTQFLAHVRGRTRRVQRGHDKAYAILEPFGGWPIPKDKGLGEAESEKILQDHLRQLATARRRAGLRFDLFSIDFWVDNAGDLQRPDPKNFPRGFAPVLRELKRTKTEPGLWIDSSMGNWTIGRNPVVASCYTHPPAYPPNAVTEVGFLCRATEPVRTMYQTAFTHHIRTNGVRMVKFDNLHAICYHPAHNHLPGLYSTEAIHNSVIEFLRTLDRANRETFLMLYWGYRSPWWLLHADTLFESGLSIEAASPGPHPTLYARDGVTQGLDMAQWFCRDVPALGKDSLGVWFSEWPWNSMIGKERWAEGFVMDLCRGSLLAQPWLGERPLTVAEEKQMAELIALLKACPKCFSNPRFILGNPWKSEPYGYECSDGRRSFVALHNCTWADRILPLDAGGRDVYRWYPRPARLVGNTARIALRPFEVVLLEFVPPGEVAALPRRFPTKPVPIGFHEPSQTLAIKMSRSRSTKSAFQLRTKIRSTKGGTLVIAVERQKAGRAFLTTSFVSRKASKELAIAARINGRPVIGQPVLADRTHGSAWQAWRFAASSHPRPRQVRALITTLLPRGVCAICKAYFVPDGD